MGIIKWIKNRAAPREAADMDSEKLLEWLGIDPGNTKDVQEATYFACLKMLSETIGKLPLKYYQSTSAGRIKADITDAGRLMTERPNRYMTPATMWATVEQNCQHYGNAYIWARSAYAPKEYGGEFRYVDMWPMQSNYVTPLIDDAGIFGGKGELYYRYGDPKSGREYILRDDEVLHFKTWFSFDGFMGEPVRNILKATLGGAREGQTFVNNLFKNGLSASIAMQYTGSFSDENIEKASKRFAERLTGPINAGKVIPVPADFELKPINATLADSQFFELKKYTALQIAAAFGIKPNHINDYTKSSYSNSETQQLAFLVDTMLYRLRMYEDEINAKMLTPAEKAAGFFYKFNEKVLLRTDSRTQMENIAKAVNNGIYTPNEARDYLDLPAMDGGDVLIVNGNYIPLTRVGEAYEKKGGSMDGDS